MQRQDTTYHLLSHSVHWARRIKFVVKRDGAVFGTLAVSNGSAVWFPRRTTIGIKMSSQKFDRIMEENGTVSERR